MTNASFIVVSAKDELDTKVDLLTLGADDYIIKPFDLKELKARILVQLRKKQRMMKEQRTLKYKEIIMKKDNHEIFLQEEQLLLTLQEYRILELLMEHQDKVFSKQEIYQYAWEEYYIGEDKTINVHISNIRQKMKKITEEEYIETIWGIGFRLKR